MIDGMPTLAQGGHSKGTGQACVMEYISVLMGLPWSDLPECTLKPIARVAQRVNDVIPNEDRHLLLPLIPRLTGTGVIPIPFTELGAQEHFVRFLAKNVQHPESRQAILERLAMYGASYSVGEEALSDCLTVLFSQTGSPQGMIDVLVDVLDEYDRIAPQGPQVCTFTPQQYTAATERVLTKV